MIRYRIYTETKENLGYLTRSAGFDATLYSGVGVWEGIQEPSTTIEILAEPSAIERVLTFADTIRQFNGQTLVIVTQEDVIQYNVTRKGVS